MLSTIFSVIKKFPFCRRYTTDQNAKYWRGRSYGWEEYLQTHDHPHRRFITHILSQIQWVSLVEIGCGSGPNLVNIVKNLKGRQVGGIDINPEAIRVAKKTFQGGHFKAGDAKDILMSDKSCDVSLTDAFLIYIGPARIKKYLAEIKRITRNYIVLCEYHEASFWRRQWLRIFSGRHAYNYKQLLSQLGFWDVTIIKMPAFEKDNDERFRHLILARLPK